MTTSTATPFPLEARVILHGLIKAPELNGKIGIVKSGISNGRQHIYIEELEKSVALKIGNLQFEERPVESLSVKELKTVLKATGVADSEVTGVDKSELKSKVAKLGPQAMARHLAEAQAPKPKTASRASVPQVDPSQAADQLSNMSPEQLRQQARMMRSMDPETIRRMNPQLAHMTNEQILLAANQMEMMAANPQAMEAARDQIKNMSPEEIQKVQQQMANPTSTTTTPSMSTTSGFNGAPSNITPSQVEQAANMMANMTPEQLKQQGEMLKNMDPDTVRRTNPSLAHMTDEQIKMAASQFEMMASNPAMMKMAMDQMKNMSPEQMEAMKRNGNPPSTPNVGQMGGDAGKLLANMDKDQLKQMLKGIKDNPEMMKQFATMSGMSEDQLNKGVDMFSNMDDGQLDQAVDVMLKVQKAKDIWTNANARTGGHLAKILVLLAVLIVVWIVNRFWFGSSSIPAQESSRLDEMPNIALANSDVEENEFDSEF